MLAKNLRGSSPPPPGPSLLPRGGHHCQMNTSNSGTGKMPESSQPSHTLPRAPGVSAGSCNPHRTTDHKLRLKSRITLI